MKKRLVVLSGAGISAESGVRTFRDSDGLWENHRVEDVASPEGFRKNPTRVLNFYNQRRRQLSEVFPNRAHEILAELQNNFEVQIITQNVDDLHERAGSRHVLHLHGELKKARPINSDKKIMSWEKDLNVGDLNEDGVQMRPHIVWFGEMVSEMENAVKIVQKADYFLVIGTSMNVYPAAGLIDYVPSDCEIFVIDPLLPAQFVINSKCFQTTATEGMRKLKDVLISKANQ